MAGSFLLKSGIRRAWRPRVGQIALFCLCLSVGFGRFRMRIPERPGGRRRRSRPPAQTLALSPQKELACGRQAYKEVLSNPREYGAVIPADRPEC